MDHAQVARIPVRIFVYWALGPEALEQCRLSAESVRRLDEDATVTLFTDQPRASAPWADEILPAPTAYPMMVANLVVQTRIAMLMLDGPVPVAFLDTDILLVKELTTNPSVDLCVTRRSYTSKDAAGNEQEGVARAMPYNYGVILANPTLPATEAFLWLRERVRRLSPQLQQWYGNQVALRELVGMEDATSYPYHTIRSLPWCRVQVEVLDAEEWNYTPEGPDEPLAGRRVLHFKGNRKHLMADYLKRIQEGRL